MRYPVLPVIIGVVFAALTTWVMVHLGIVNFSPSWRLATAYLIGVAWGALIPVVLHKRYLK